MTLESAAHDAPRTFSAPTLREALAQVRRELGPEALILGQSRSGRSVEVRAALEAPTGEADHAATATATATVQPDVQIPASAVPLDAAVVIGESAAGDAQPLDPASAAGYSPQVVEELSTGTDLEAFRQTLCQRLNYAHRSIAQLHGRYRFVGSSGVGKTATLIKVLAGWVARNDPREVVVISTDNERLAGTEALQLAAQMLGVRIVECAPAALPRELEQVKRKALVLIDAPALQMHKPATSTAGVQDIWVCSALHGVPQLEAQYALVRSIRPAGVVVTQLDQSAANDGIANLLYRWRIPLYWLGSSAALPEGIDQAGPDSTYHLMFQRGGPVVLDVAV